jgi:hypothetical protein
MTKLIEIHLSQVPGPVADAGLPGLILASVAFSAGGDGGSPHELGVIADGPCHRRDEISRPRCSLSPLILLREEAAGLPSTLA